MPKMYEELATWWGLISPVEDYAEEAGFFLETLKDAGAVEKGSLLELGSGGGSNAFYLKEYFGNVTLTDLAPQMLELSRGINPECTHIQGDMRTLRLGREFDVVFVHDAIDYMTTEQALREAFETAAIHCKPGGIAMFVPDHVQERFEPDTDHGGSDAADRALRYLEWTYDPDPTDTTVVTEYVYVLRRGNEPVQVEHDHHVTGLFPRETWLTLLREVGFEPEIVEDAFEREVFVGRKNDGVME